MSNLQQLEEETWVKIKGYENAYEVSSKGRVRTLEKVIEIKSKAGWSRLHPVKQKVKTANKTKVGYLTISLIVGNKTTTTYLHRIIAEAFLPNPNCYKVINHKNGIKWDNRIENLEWCTHGHNNKHAIDQRLRTPAHCQLNEKTALQIKEMKRQKLSSREISKKIGVSQSIVTSLLSGRSYKFLRV